MAILTIEQARECLRLDGPDNDTIIQSLLAAIPGYIEVTTGMAPARQETEPLASTAAKFLLQLWYNTEQSDAAKLQRTIDSLLAALSLMV